MKRKKELDILLNGNDEIVETLALRPVLTKKEREKMLEMSKRKLADMKAGFVISDSDNESGDSVRGVERYNRSIIMRRVMAAAACLVVAGGIAGTAMLMKKNGGSRGVKGDSNIINPAVATTSENDENETNTTIVSTSVNKTTVTSVGTADITGTSSDIQTTSVFIPSTAVNGEVSAEEAALSYMEAFTADDAGHLNIQYALIDMNKDNVPELFISCENQVATENYVCVFDGNQYIDQSPEHGFGGNLMISPENGMFTTSGKYLRTIYAKIGGDNKIEVLDDLASWWDAETESNSCWHGNEKITESEYQNIISQYSVYNWTEPEYTFYAEKDGYYIDNAPDLHTDINIDKLIEMGVLPAGDREIKVCYGFLDSEADAASTDFLSADSEDFGGVVGGEYSTSSGTISDVYPHYGQGRRFRIRAEIHEGSDNKSYLLAAADVDYATGECKIIENKYPDAVNMHF